ncbi:MAG: isopentenyl-diphosphate Delta-isomerase [Propionibacteriaceae bacterium]|nr:isopentenyl-diphosphate Delta-isomerase [Propionibacteriaceae bacterium]
MESPTPVREPAFQPDGVTADEVVLLDDHGDPIGAASRLSIHTDQTPLHLAFSTYLFDADGRVLITRRALGKTTWPGVWTNSCCGHPRPGEDIEAAARRRVREELGLEVTELRPAVPDFRYRAVDASGIVENEFCPVFIGHVASTSPTPDPDEVAEYAWVPWEDLVAAIAATPAVYSPWSVLQVPRVAAALDGLDGSSAGPTTTAGGFVDSVDAVLTATLADLADGWDAVNRGEGVEVLPADLPAWLERLLVGRGKRLRATMLYWAFVAAGGDTAGPDFPGLVRIAAALETLHLFAMVHDDIMDESASRRGLPAAHVEAADWHRQAGAAGDPDAFGINLAILLGDLAHTLADSLVQPLPARVRRLWFELCVELMVGQRADLTGAAAGRRDLPHAQHIARLKSGKYTIERPLQLGALTAGADAAAYAALQQWGEHVGRAFALRDDQLGIWGDPALTGKPAGDDLAEGKATVILALASERLEGPAREALDRLGSVDLRPGDVAMVSDALVDTGVRDGIETMIEDAVARADACLTHAGLSAAGIEGLRAAARTIAWRNA